MTYSGLRPRKCKICGTKILNPRKRIYCSHRCYNRRYSPRDKERARNKGRQRRNLSLIAYSSSPPFCKCCGEKEYKFLTIDHINGVSNRKHRNEIGRGGSALYSWLVRNNFPPGFQVLCYNCNCAKGHYGVCPHSMIQSKLGNDLCEVGSS